jgi:hypothetical protein
LLGQTRVLKVEEKWLEMEFYIGHCICTHADISCPMVEGSHISMCKLPNRIRPPERAGVCTYVLLQCNRRYSEWFEVCLLFGLRLFYVLKYRYIPIHIHVLVCNSNSLSKNSQLSIWIDFVIILCFTLLHLLDFRWGWVLVNGRYFCATIGYFKQ